MSRGNPGRPLTEAELTNKFMANAVPVLGEEASRRVVELVYGIESLHGSDELCKLLSEPKVGP